MSLEWTSEPMSLESIIAEFSLPIAIKPAFGFYGSAQPAVLHSEMNANFGYAYGRVPNNQTTEDEEDRSVISETSAIPLKYPGYFKCLTNSTGELGIMSNEKSVASIVRRIQAEHQPQTFYTVEPMRVYTLKKFGSSVPSRQWHSINSNKMVTFEKIIQLQYIPTEKDNLTADDINFSCFFCCCKKILPRNEAAIQCYVPNECICYIPCSSTDELNLLPVGLVGSDITSRLQTMENLIAQFRAPINIKLTKMPGSLTFSEFGARFQMLGTRHDDFAVCASLSSKNVVLIPKNVSVRFVVAPLADKSSEIEELLGRCETFIQTFHSNIHPILISVDATIPKKNFRLAEEKAPRTPNSIGDKLLRLRRANTIDGRLSKIRKSLADESERATLLATRTRQAFKKQTSLNDAVREHSILQSTPLIRAKSTIDNTYGSLGSPKMPKAKKNKIKPAVSVAPQPHLATTNMNFAFPVVPYPTMFTYNSGSKIIELLDLPDANGAILVDSTDDIFSQLPQS